MGAIDAPLNRVEHSGRAMYMSEHLFEQPILNSPCEHLGRRWEQDDGQPTNRIVDSRPAFQVDHTHTVSEGTKLRRTVRQAGR